MSEEIDPRGVINVGAELTEEQLAEFRQQWGAAIASEMPRILRADATTLASIAARYQNRPGAERAVAALLGAYTEVLTLDPESLLLAAESATVFGVGGEERKPVAPPDDGRLRIVANDPSGVLLSEILVGGGFVRTEQSVRQAFRGNLVMVDGSFVGTDKRLPAGTVAVIKVGDQDERVVEIRSPK